MQKAAITFSLLFYLSSLLGQIPISAIQGTGEISPYLGEKVRTEAVRITAVGTGTIFTQSLPADIDNNELTSEGLWIQFSNAGLEPGDIVQCEGVIAEDGSGNTIMIAENINKTGERSEPSPVKLDTIFDLRDRSLLTYESLEGQLISFEMGLTSEPSERSNVILVNPYGQRSFREPGVSYPNTITGIPQFDENPELISIIPGRFFDIDLTELQAGSSITCTGVVVQRPGEYAVWPTFLGVESNDDIEAPPIDDELTMSIASLNLRQFGTDDRNFSTRMVKAATYIKEIAGYPDILALQEIKDRNALERLIKEIGQTPEGYEYSYYFNPGSSSSSIHCAYLYKNCFQNVEFRRLGLFESLGSGGVLHDRPPLLMSFEHPEDSTRMMRVLNLHLRSLNGIEGSSASFVRQKRYEQAVSVAQMIYDFPDNDPLIVLGDFNAFQFTDGYVDVFAQISGKKSLGALIPVMEILRDSLDYPLEKLPSAEQYSYIFNGHSQFLDHILTRNTSDFLTEEYFMLRGNADAPSIWEDDPTREWRVTDHDGILAHYRLGRPLECSVADKDINALGLNLKNPGNFNPLSIEVEIPANRSFSIELLSIDGKLIFDEDYEIGRGIHRFFINQPVVPGIYLLRLSQGTESLIRKVILH